MGSDSFMQRAAGAAYPSVGSPPRVVVVAGAPIALHRTPVRFMVESRVGWEINGPCILALPGNRLTVFFTMLQKAVPHLAGKTSCVGPPGVFEERLGCPIGTG